MKHYFILLMLFSLTSGFSQIGKSYSEIHKAYPQKEERLLRTEGDYLIEDLQLSEDEAMMAVYSKKDTIAVGIGYLNDNGITEKKYNAILMREFPKFKLSKKAKWNGGIYNLDETNHLLTIQHSQQLKSTFPLHTFMIIAAPKVIEIWTKDITTWE